MATTAVSSAISYARENQQRFLNELKDLLRIPSVSTAEEHKSDILKAADMVADDLKRIGFETRGDHSHGRASIGVWRLAACGGQADGTVLCAL